MHNHGHSTKACGLMRERFRGELKQIRYISEVVVLLGVMTFQKVFMTQLASKAKYKGILGSNIFEESNFL